MSRTPQKIIGISNKKDYNSEKKVEEITKEYELDKKSIISRQKILEFVFKKISNDGTAM